MSEANDLVEEEAFIASSFVDFHTEEPASPGDWIPMTEEEASGRWESWITEHDRQVAERAWDEGQKAGLLRADFEYGAIGYQHVRDNPYTNGAEHG